MKTRLIHLLLVLLCAPGMAQDPPDKERPGEISAKIFSNFNYGLNEDDPLTAFEITRAYFGYEKYLSEHFFANVKLDIGSPDDISEFSRIRRYAYFKNASIGYRNNKLTAWAGLFDMLQFKTQEGFWGYRYLYRSFLDEYRFGPSADIGIAVRYAFSNWLSADLTLSNGEGHNSPQRDDTYKTGTGITIYPFSGFTIRGYYSIFTHTNPQMTFSGFTGYSTDKFRIGAEFNLQRNYQFNPGHHRYGYSAYSTFIISEKWEVFGRYDQLYSNILEDDLIPWNLPQDGSALIAGIQYTPVRNIHISVDYQDWVEYAGNGSKHPYIYLHIETIF